MLSMKIKLSSLLLTLSLLGYMNTVKGQSGNSLRYPFMISTNKGVINYAYTSDTRSGTGLLYYGLPSRILHSMAADDIDDFVPSYANEFYFKLTVDVPSRIRIKNSSSLIGSYIHILVLRSSGLYVLKTIIGTKDFSFDPDLALTFPGPIELPCHPDVTVDLIPDEYYIAIEGYDVNGYIQTSFEGRGITDADSPNYLLPKVDEYDIIYTYDLSGNMIEQNAIMLDALATKSLAAESRELLLDNETNSIKVYPNPTYGQLKLEIENYNDVKFCSINIVSVSNGIVVYKNSSVLPVYGIDLSSRQNGVYIMNINIDGKNFVRKIIKK